jgi:hypothetical protein
VSTFEGEYLLRHEVVKEVVKEVRSTVEGNSPLDKSPKKALEFRGILPGVEPMMSLQVTESFIP